MNTIAITGASGYIGRHLVAKLVRMGDRRIKVLSRSSRQEWHVGLGESVVEIVKGDVRDPKSLRGLIDPGCTVINLVYLQDAGEAENLVACAELLAACKAAKVRRLIHCSTASVVGRTPDNLVTEDTPCRPATGYGVAKLKVERAIIEAARGCFEATILRPTAVFGPEGENLRKLAGDLMAGARLRNYLRSCLFGSRRMNLVYVANVVAAILFLANYDGNLGEEVFNISDSDSPLNNFSDVERILMREMNIPDYSFARIAAPLGLLRLLLEFRGRDNINPRCNYSSEKLIGFGFLKPTNFERGLAEYATWYRSSHPDGITSSSV